MLKDAWLIPVTAGIWDLFGPEPEPEPEPGVGGHAMTPKRPLEWHGQVIRPGDILRSFVSPDPETGMVDVWWGHTPLRLPIRYLTDFKTASFLPESVFKKKLPFKVTITPRFQQNITDYMNRQVKFAPYTKDHGTSNNPPWSEGPADRIQTDIRSNDIYEPTHGVGGGEHY